MSTASVTSKGQVTIPAKIRRLLSIKAGDRLLFESEGDEVRIRVVARRKASDFLGVIETGKSFPGHAAVRQSTAKALAKRHQSRRP
jgi:AbrB family looped-hinge helix DNA binding protein